MQTPYTENVIIRSNEADATERISITSLAGLMQDVAVIHANNLGFGYDALRKDNLFWAISKMKFEIKRLPLWREKCSISTWHKGYSGIASLREFLVKDDKDEVLIRATSTWIVVDLNDRKIKRSEDVCGDLELLTEDAIEKPSEKVIIPSTVEMKKVGEIFPQFSNVDMNAHVNNVNYYTWAFDYLPEDLYKVNLKSILINFVSEAKYHQTMDIFYGKEGSIWFCEMKNQETGTTHCKLAIGV
jgi:acyl-ACP thioesterase